MKTWTMVHFLAEVCERGVKYMGAPRFLWSSHWDATPPVSQGLMELPSHIRLMVASLQRQFALWQQQRKGAAKAIICYVTEVLSPEEAKMAEPWKRDTLASKMVLLRLRVMETPAQIATFGWNAVQQLSTGIVIYALVFKRTA